LVQASEGVRVSAREREGVRVSARQREKIKRSLSVLRHSVFMSKIDSLCLALTLTPSLSVLRSLSIYVQNRLSLPCAHSHSLSLCLALEKSYIRVYFGHKSLYSTQDRERSLFSRNRIYESILDINPYILPR